MNKKILLIIGIILQSTLSIKAKIGTLLELNIDVSAFDKKTGTWYLGTAQDLTQSIFSVQTINHSDELKVTSLSQENDPELNMTLNGMTLAYRADGNPYLAFFKNTGLMLIIKDIASGETRNVINLNLNNGGAFGGNVRSVTATNAMKKDGDATDYNFIMSLVSSDNQPFMDAAAGITLAKLTETSTLENLGTLAFTDSSAWVKGTGGNIETATSGGCITWNNDLQRLFVGISGRSINNDFNNSIITLSCFKLNDAFTGLDNIQMNGALEGYDSGATEGTSSIVGARSGDAVAMSIRHLCIMKTSTNHYYAIMNGGKGTLLEIATKIRAIPLVGPEGDNPGTLAAVYNSTKGVVDFTTRATGSTQLFHETDAPVIVGNMSLPCPGGVNIDQAVFNGVETEMLVKQMEVVGDTVYCATSGVNNADNQPGLYFSQAIFNNYGAIIGWTDWALATPAHISGTANDNAQCHRFAIDTARGRIITIPTFERRQINATRWTYQTNLTTFGGQINNLLQGPCYSHLVLDQYVENVGNKVRGRFALFGGNGKVIAIRTGLGKEALYTTPNKPTPAWNDTGAAAVDFSYGLPASPINCLGYSYLSEGDINRKNFFVAGTNVGLYIYTLRNTDLSGFSIDGDNILSSMDHENCIFKTGKWNHFFITDPVIKIVTITPGLISVLARGPQGHYIAEILIGGSLTGNVGDDFLVDSNLYETDTLNDYNITDMYDILPVKKGNNSTLLTATNQGIIGSRLPLSFAHKTIIHHFSTPQKTRGNSMFWFVKRTNDVTTGSVVAKARIYQATIDYINSDSLNTTTTNLISLVPAHPITTDIHTFTLSNDNDADRHNNLHTLDMITTPLYSNGSLRFFGMRTYAIDDTTYSKLVTLPYRTHHLETNITHITDIPDADLQDVQAVYWIDNVGAGYTMAGTDKGVISLE